jgi:hypothetical protein
MQWAHALARHGCMGSWIGVQGHGVSPLERDRVDDVCASQSKILSGFLTLGCARNQAKASNLAFIAWFVIHDAIARLSPTDFVFKISSVTVSLNTETSKHFVALGVTKFTT